MIDKLFVYKTGQEIWGNYYETEHPTKEDIVAKINEIIDYLNKLQYVDEKNISCQKYMSTELVQDLSDFIDENYSDI